VDRGGRRTRGGASAAATAPCLASPARSRGGVGRYTLHTSHHTLHTTRYTLHTVHCTLHTTHSALLACARERGGRRTRGGASGAATAPCLASPATQGDICEFQQPSSAAVELHLIEIDLCVGLCTRERGGGRRRGGASAAVRAPCLASPATQGHLCVSTRL